MRNRVFAFSGIAALINYSATSAIGFFVSLYLQYLKGLDARTAGLIMISQPVAMMLLSPLAGRLSDKRNPGEIASAGMGITAIGLILMCFIRATTPDYLIVLLLLLMGIGFGLFSSPNSNAIMSSVEKRYLGVASGVVGTMRMVGQMTVGRAGCVLLRALEPVAGLKQMAQNRGLPPAGQRPIPTPARKNRLPRATIVHGDLETEHRVLTCGPSRLCQALGLARTAQWHGFARWRFAAAGPGRWVQRR